MKKVLTAAAVLVTAVTVASVASAGQARVDVCHVHGNGDIEQITVAEPAYQSHIDHGDAAVSAADTIIAATDARWVPNNAGGIERLAQVEVSYANQSGSFYIETSFGTWLVDVDYVEFGPDATAMFSGTAIAATDNLAQFLGQTIYVVVDADANLLRSGVSGVEGVTPAFAIAPYDFGNATPFTAGDMTFTDIPGGC